VAFRFLNIIFISIQRNNIKIAFKNRNATHYGDHIACYELEDFIKKFPGLDLNFFSTKKLYITYKNMIKLPEIIEQLINCKIIR